MIVLGGGVCKHQIANAMLIVSDGWLLNDGDGDCLLAQRGGFLSIHCRFLMIFATGDSPNT
jgi:hypothetical protein